MLSSEQFLQLVKNGEGLQVECKASVPLSEVADDFGHRSLSRNPFIFDMFTRMHLVEQVGSGIPRMCRLMNDMGLPNPIFNTKGMFSITFSRMESENDGVESKNVGVEVKNDGVEIEIKLNDTQSDLLEILSGNGIFSAKKLSEMMLVTQRTIERNLSFLQKNGFVKREGSDRYGKWIVLKKK